MDRHQQRRGQKLPDGVKSVARPSRWGNPFRLGVIKQPVEPWTVDPATGLAVMRLCTLDEVLAMYRLKACDLFANDPAWFEPLQEATGLACYCPLDQGCHADILIELLERLSNE